MNRKLMNKLLDEILEKLDLAINDESWSYTQEYWMGILDSAKILIKKVKDDL